MPVKTCQRCNGTGQEPDQSRIGNDMRKAREHAGLKQGVVSKRLDISQAYLSDLERGRRAWSSDLISRFINAITMNTMPRRPR